MRLAPGCKGRQLHFDGPSLWTDPAGTAIFGSPTDFGKIVAADNDIEKWAKVVKFSGASRIDPRVPVRVTCRQTRTMMKTRLLVSCSFIS
jgi:hypothetical protein